MTPHPCGAEEETQGLQGWGQTKGRASGEMEALQAIDSLRHHGKRELAAKQDRRAVRTEQPADLPGEQLVHLYGDMAKPPRTGC